MKTQVPFETYPVNAALDPSGCFAMKLKDLQIVNDDSVFEEVVKEKTLPMSPELLEFGFRCVLSTMADRVSKDCRPRKVGNIIKATPYLRGKLKSAYSAFDKNTCSCAIVFTSLSGLEKSVNTDKYIQFVNTKTGTRVIIDRIAYEGCVDSSQIATIMRGKGIAVTGLNCQWLEGDACTLVWKNADGVEQTENIEPVSSMVTEMRFAWPTALDGVAAGTVVEFRFRTRGGIEDGEPQPNAKSVTVLVNDSPTPPPTGHATLVGVTTSPDDGPDELSIADGLCLVFDKADPEGATGHLVVNGVVQGCPVTVDTAMGGAMWEFGRDELVGQSVNFKFRYEDGTEVGNVTKTIRAGK